MAAFSDIQENYFTRTETIFLAFKRDIMVIRSWRKSFLSSFAAKEAWEVEGGAQTHTKCVQDLIFLLGTHMQNMVSGVRPTLSRASVFPLSFKWHLVAVDIPHTLKLLTDSEFLSWECICMRTVLRGSSGDYPDERQEESTGGWHGTDR